MGLSRRQFTREFKLAAVRRLEAGVSLAEVARGLEVSPNVLDRWRREFRQAPGNAFPGHGQRRWSEGRVAELERKIGQQAVEIDFCASSKGWCIQREEQTRRGKSQNPVAWMAACSRNRDAEAHRQTHL
jgi:transposase-like protein